MEIWRNIKDYPDYQVSNMGRVKSLNYNRTGKEKILKNIKNNFGYLYVRLCKDGKQKNYTIHRLVATAFIDNPNNYPIINHINEDKTDNRVENLEWCTQQYNINFGTSIERAAKNRSIPVLQFTKEGELVRKWESATQVERELGYNLSHISECCKGKRKTCGGYKWRYHHKSLWEKNHVPLIKQRKVA